LDSAVRDYLGWDEVVRHSVDLDLTENQKNQAVERRRQADETAASRLLQTYTWGLVPTEPDPGSGFRISVRKVEGSAPALAERVTKRLGNEGELNKEQAASTIRLALNAVPQLWAAGHVPIGDLWEAYAQYPYLPRLRDQSVLNSGVVNQPLLWDRDGFALAEGLDPESGRYQGLWLPDDHGTPPLVTNATVVVHPAKARTQREEDEAASRRAADDPQDQPDGPSSGTGTAAAYAPDGHSTVTAEPGQGGTPNDPGAGAVPARPGKTRYFGTRELQSDRAGTEFKKVYDEVISHLVQPGVQVRIRLDIEATNPDGFAEDVVRVVGENSRTLKFDQGGFEES